MLDRADWLESRRKGIGGSDVAAILGLSPWKTPMDVYLSKVSPPEDKDSKALLRGRVFEQAVADWYAEETGTGVTPGGTMIHPGPESWMFGSPDFWVEGSKDTEWGLECKTSRSMKDWGRPGTAQIPLYYAIQCRWYMACTNTDRWDLAVFFTVADDFAIYSLDRDQDVERQMVTTCRQWWEKHIVGETPPPIDGGMGSSELLKQQFPQHSSPLREATDTEGDVACRLGEIKAVISRLKDEQQHLENQIKQHIGDNEGLYGNWGKVTWKNRKASSRLDTTRLRNDHPDIAEQYTKTGQPTRVLRLDYNQQEK